MSDMRQRRRWRLEPPASTEAAAVAAATSAYAAEEGGGWRSLGEVAAGIVRRLAPAAGPENEGALPAARRASAA